MNGHETAETPNVYNPPASAPVATTHVLLNDAQAAAGFAADALKGTAVGSVLGAIKLIATEVAALKSHIGMPAVPALDEILDVLEAL